MHKNKEMVVNDWGQAPPMAPSIKRADPLGWITASLLAGGVVGLLALAMSWRAFPGLPAPQGTFAQHVTIWAEMALRCVMRNAFRDDAKLYAAFWAGLADSERNAIIWRAAWAIWASLMPAVLLRKSFLTPRDNLIHLRGALRHEGVSALQLLRSRFAFAAKERPDHEIAPGIPYPSDMWTRHVLLIGGTGSGKSTAIKPLIDKVIKAKERLILFDPKGEFTMGFAEPAIIAPWDKRSFSWDIARDLRNIGDMRRFAAAMIEDSQDPMWANASRQILVGFVIYLKRTRGNRWGWRELADLVAMSQASLLSVMSKYHPEAVRAVERASVTTQGILINLSSFCASIFDLAEAWGDVPESRRISFVEWTLGKSRQTQIILQGHGSYTELSKSYVRGIIEVIAAIVNSVEMEDDPNRKLWVIADEFPQMGKVPIRPLFEVGRSRGVRCVVACQDLAQLEEVHGERMVKALVSMSGTLLVGQIMQGETAEQVAKALGTREVERANLSSSYAGTGGSSNRSTTLSFARDELPIYKPSELASRLGPTPDGKGVIMSLVTGGQAYEVFWPRYHMRRERLSYVPAEWTLGVGRDEEPKSWSDIAAQANAEKGTELADDRGGKGNASSSDQPAGKDDPVTAQRLEAIREQASVRTAETAIQKIESHDRVVRGDDKSDGEAGSAQRELVADATRSRPPVVADQAPGAMGAELIGQLLRESLDVVADPPRAVSGHAIEAGHIPITEAVAELAMDGMEAGPLSVAAKAVNLAAMVSDSRPGPKQEVRNVQRGPFAPTLDQSKQER